MDIARKVTIRRWDNKTRDFINVPTFVELELDVDGILQLVGRKALANKSGKTRYLSGLIKASARRVAKSDDAVAS